MMIKNNDIVGNWFQWIVDLLLTLSLTGVIFFSSIQVFFRYVLNKPLLGSEELARLFGVWMTFLGSSVAIHENSHIKVDILQQRLSARMRYVIDWIVNIILFIFSVIVLVIGLKFTIRSYILKSPALRFSMSIFYSAVTVGCLLNCIYLIQIMVSNILKMVKKPNKGNKSLDKSNTGS